MPSRMERFARCITSRGIARDRVATTKRATSAVRDESEAIGEGGAEAEGTLSTIARRSRPSMGIARIRDMGQTIAEKILGAHAGRPARAGDVVVARVDFAMIH